MNFKKKEVMIQVKMCFFVMVLFIVSMHGMEKNEGYVQLTLESSNGTGRVELARTIEKTKLDLRNELGSWYQCCCKRRIFGLEQNLAELTQRKEEIERDEVGFVIQDLSDHRDGTKVKYKNKKLATMRGLLVHDLKNITKLTVSHNSLVTLPLSDIVHSCPALRHLDG
jgi:hypothetical protein